MISGEKSRIKGTISKRKHKIILKTFQAKTTKPGERFQVEHRRETKDVQRAAGQGQKGSRRNR
jgi:hypothetical protein